MARSNDTYSGIVGIEYILPETAKDNPLLVQAKLIIRMQEKGSDTTWIEEIDLYADVEVGSKLIPSLIRAEDHNA